MTHSARYTLLKLSACVVLALLISATGAVPAQAQSAPNVVPNSSVEAAGTGGNPASWLRGSYGANTRAFAYPVAGVDGADAVRVSISAHTSGDAKWYFAPVAVSGGQSYEYAEWYRSNVPTTVTVQYQLQDNTYRYVEIGTAVPAASSWTRFVREITVPADFGSPVKNVTVFHRLARVGWLETDDFSLERVAEPPPSSLVPAGNIILNPSLESADGAVPHGWVKGGTGANTRVMTYPVAGVDGAKAAKAEITSYTAGVAQWAFDPVAVTPGTMYVFQDWYRASVPSAMTAQFTLADGTYKYVDFPGTVPAASSWTKVTRNLYAPPAGTWQANVTHVSVFHYIAAKGWLVTDAFGLTKKSMPAADPANLLPNAAFEYPNGAKPFKPASWTTSTSSGATAVYSYPVVGRNSDAAAQVQVTAFTGGAGAKWYAADPIPVQPKQDYEYTGWYKASGKSVLMAIVTLGDGSAAYIDLRRMEASASWKQVRAVFNAPKGAVSVQVMHQLQAVGTLTIDDVKLRKLGTGAFTQGMVTLSFDDGLTSVYQNAIPMLRAANLKSSQYIISEWFGRPDIVTPAQVDAMRAEGHEIGSHTRTHGHLWDMNSAQVQSEIAGSKADLEALGHGIATFAYPYGEFNDVTEAALRNAGYRGARTVQEGFNTRNTSPFALVDQHIELGVPVSRITGFIDQAIADKTWLILEIHGITMAGTTYSYPPADFQKVVDHLKLRGVKVVTMSEGLAAMGY